MNCFKCQKPATKLCDGKIGNGTCDRPNSQEIIRVPLSSKRFKMTQSEFIDLVAQMRTTQKKYFKTRSNLVLAESKALESEVDRYIEQLKQKVEQLSLSIEEI